MGKPEIKFDQEVFAGPVTGGNSLSNIISTATMTQGTDYGNRIGRRIRTRKIYLRMLIQSDSLVTAQAPTRNYYIRVVWWSPRLSSASSLTYMSALQANVVPDYNVATIFADKMYSLAYVYDGTVVPAGITVQAEGKSQIFIKKKFKWIRNINWRDGVTAVEDPKDLMYMTVYNYTNLTDIAINFTSQIFYIDQ